MPSDCVLYEIMFNVPNPTVPQFVMLVSDCVQISSYHGEIKFEYKPLHWVIIINGESKSSGRRFNCPLFPTILKGYMKLWLSWL